MVDVKLKSPPTLMYALTRNSYNEIHSVDEVEVLCRFDSPWETNMKLYVVSYDYQVEVCRQDDVFDTLEAALDKLKSLKFSHLHKQILDYNGICESKTTEEINKYLG